MASAGFTSPSYGGHLLIIPLPQNFTRGDVSKAKPTPWRSVDAILKGRLYGNRMKKPTGARTPVRGATVTLKKPIVADVRPSLSANRLSIPA